MWYVIQTKTGYEELLKAQLESLSEPGLFDECLIPLFEDVWKHGGSGRISIRRLFPGYLFVETGHPGEVHLAMKQIPNFTSVLHMEDPEETRLFVPVEPEEESFLRTILDNGMMHASYVRKAKSGNRIDEIAGPLALYAKQIVRLDLPHRRAIVEAELFGKLRRIKFGLWTDADPRHPWLERQRGLAPADYRDYVKAYEFREDDLVSDASGVYPPDLTFRVLRVHAVRRIVETETELFGRTVRVELDADQVRRAIGIPS